MIIRGIITFSLVALISVVSVFANVQENQKFINENFSKISELPIPKDAIDAFNDLPSNVVIPEDATFGEFKKLVEDGVDGPVTQAAMNSIKGEISKTLNDIPPTTPVTTPQPATPQPVTPQPASNQGTTKIKPCEFDIDGGNKDIGKALDDCLTGSALVDATGDIRVEKGMKDQILKWTLALAQLLGLLSVGAIVYGGLLMTLSGGEEEKIKKGKDVVKWAIVGFLGVLFAGVLVRVVVEVIFTIATIT